MSRREPLAAVVAGRLNRARARVLSRGRCGPRRTRKSLHSPTRQGPGNRPPTVRHRRLPKASSTTCPRLSTHALPRTRLSARCRGRVVIPCSGRPRGVRHDATETSQFKPKQLYQPPPCRLVVERKLRKNVVPALPGIPACSARVALIIAVGLNGPIIAVVLHTSQKAGVPDRQGGGEARTCSPRRSTGTAASWFGIIIQVQRRATKARGGPDPNPPLPRSSTHMP